MSVVLFRDNLENVKGRGIFREICENFRVSGGILPIIRKFGRLPNDSGDLATLHTDVFWEYENHPKTQYTNSYFSVNHTKFIVLVLMTLVYS